ncbi:HSCARG dehydrogenase [Purpureocillium lavendulum]|uniref:HSCARG dehydrogenase n=1 Tax=Purpureocillium lavendulum TaxID=1247861 RepID=A0AB34FIQ9_9HYPO|nr:HSCARG dehydrogenase [Purpureocillium lavendulum]
MSIGGSVVKQLLKSPQWIVRGITRNAEGAKAKALASQLTLHDTISPLGWQGVQVVQGDINDEGSLAKALDGVAAIYVVTAFYESVASVGLEGAAKVELEQYQKVARVAARLPTLKHLVLSTLPPASKSTGGKHQILHFDYKQQAVDWIKANTPDLWEKTTEFWPGWYTSNLLQPFMQPVNPPYSGTSLLLLPSKPGAMLPISGDLETNCGIVVEGILKTGSAAYKKIAICITEYLPISDVATRYGAVAGRPVAYVEVPDAVYEQMWGIGGYEFATQLRWSEAVPDWHKIEPERVISFADLGIEGKLVNFQQALEALKPKLA